MGNTNIFGDMNIIAKCPVFSVVSLVGGREGVEEAICKGVGTAYVFG